MSTIAQVGGTHYEADYQHWDWAADTRLPYLEACATKYLSRWRQKGGVQDLEKARSYVLKVGEVVLRMGDLSSLSGYRKSLDHGCRERFIRSAGVPAREAGIIQLIDVMTSPTDVSWVIDRITELAADARLERDDPTGQDAPFGYPGDG